ncbi:MAG: efflux RND transporter periplasmic adaptor subunit, partial [Planctomycetia bacterium]|nr:efflux RND transporter periplasmic adaptor subunit [Planctomycetia bacterium]
SRESARELEKSRVAKLHRQIAYCKIPAPADGVVVYANDPNRLGGRQSPQIEEGATVRERQVIFFLPDLSRPLRVNSKIPESIVDRLSPGLRARVKVDAFPDETFTGVVEAVAPLPDLRTVFNPDLKVYTTRVTIEGGLPGLRPGMTAQVEILVRELDNVLSVPVEAVVRYDGKDHVAVKTPDGAIAWREVTLGLSNDARVEVKGGLKSGETVALEPLPLLSEEQKRKVSQPPSGPRPPGRGDGLPKAKGKGAGIPPALRAKLQAMAPEDRVKLRDANAEEREAILKKAGLTVDEVRQLRQGPGAPR